MGKRAVELGLVVLACLALAGCSDDKGGGGGGDRLTAAELTTQGNAVCTAVKEDVVAAADTVETGITFTPEKMQEFYTKLVPVLDKAIAGFKKLNPPEDLEPALDSAIEQAELDQKTLVGATNSQEAAKNFYDVGVDPFTATGQKLLAAGITGCREAPAEDTTTTGAGTPSTDPTTTTTAG